MPPVLITGGAGFVGSHLIRHLLATDPNLTILNFDALAPAVSPALADPADEPRYRFVRGNIADRTAVRRVVSTGVQAIFNLAVEYPDETSGHDSGPFVRTNVLGTQVLLDAAREFHVARFVQVSTAEVYGWLGPTGCFTEESPAAPTSSYAASKAAADWLVLSHVHTFGLPAVVTRCAANFGPGQGFKEVVPSFIRSFLQDEPVALGSAGLHVRDWIHVRDHCAALERVWRVGQVGEVYNIGARCERSDLNLAHALLAVMGKPPALVCCSEDQPESMGRQSVDTRKLERELDWRPRITFAEGLRETVSWFRERWQSAEPAPLRRAS